MNNEPDENFSPFGNDNAPTDRPSVTQFPPQEDDPNTSPNPKPKSSVSFDPSVQRASIMRQSMRSSTSATRPRRKTNQFFSPTFVEFFQNKGKDSDKTFEDGRITRVEFEKLQIFDIATAVISLITISLTVFVYDLEFENEEDERAIFLLWLLFVTGITTSILNALRFLQYLQFLKARHLIASDDGLRSSGLFPYLLLEQSILLLQPYPFLRNIRIELFNSYYGVDYFYNLNDFLSIFAIFRLYIVIRFLLNSTKFRSTRAQRIAGMYGFENDYLFVIKCLFKTAPLTFCVIFFSASILIFGYTLRICERPVNRTSARGTDYSYYGNSFWVIILTMTTVGYGDYLPTTIFGRIVAFIVCLWGVSIVSLMILSITTTLELDSSEKTALLVLMKLQKRSLHKDEATNLISNLAQLSILKNKWYISLDKKKNIVNSYKKQIKSQAKSFQSMNRDLRNMQNDNIKEDMRRQFIYLEEDIENLKHSQENLQTFLTSLMNYEIQQNV